MELSRVLACCLDTGTQTFQLMLVTNSDVNVRGMVVGRATEEIRVLDGCMSCLHGLLREWDIAARDGVKIVLGALHDNLTG
jgi:hypothetical protein